MKIDDNFTIEPESNCWTLNYRRENPINEATGKATITTWQTFHMTLKQALDVYFDHKLKQGEIVPANIIEIGKAIETVYKQIQKL